MFAQFPDLEPAERKRRWQEQERQQQQQQQRQQQPNPRPDWVDPSVCHSDALIGSPRFLPACTCGVAGSSAEQCTVCNTAWWCTRCFASQCACLTEDDRRAAAADAMSGVVDLCSPDSSPPIAAPAHGTDGAVSVASTDSRASAGSPLPLAPFVSTAAENSEGSPSR